MISSNAEKDGLPTDNCLSAGGEKEVLLRAIFPGESEMAQRMRAFDWAASDFGPVGHWPENLRVAVRLCLTSRFPILLWWGPRLALLYNDAYLSWLTETKHPRALGRPGYECWSEIWDIIEPMMEGVLSTGQATWSVDTELYFDRKVGKEEVYITWTYAPILAADGRTVDGIFNPCFETTEKVIGARRLETLRKLSLRAGEGRTVETACQEAAAVLGESTRDIPFAAIYVANETGDEANLCATMVPEGEHLPPLSVSASDDHARSPWPLASVLQTKHAAECADLDARGMRLSGGPWPEATRQALVLPIHAAQDQLAGLLVVGVSPRRPLDAAYRTFFDLVAGHVATAISDARAYEAERQRAEVLAELYRAKTAFFSNVSHEFRTPLTLMLGPIEDMLARATDEFSGSREELDLVHRNTLRLLKLVNTLLDLSRIEAGRIEAVYEPTDLAAHTAELAGVFRSAIERAGLTLSVDCRALPEPVYVDREMWEKIVLNLLSNAFKFTFAGGVTVGLRWCGECVELTVADTGVGIPEAELPHIFERFHRVRDARSRTHEGTGIGLALVSELAKLHGGEVTVESAEGRGTTFFVSIPTGTEHLPQERIGAERTMASTAMGATPFMEEALRWLSDAEVSNQSAVAPPAPPTTGDKQRTAGKARILIADDNADMRQYVQRLLADRYTVTAVADGVAALGAAQGEPPDLILADVMMPNLDGFGLLRAVRNDARLAGVPVVLLSARAGEEATVEGMQAGADDYLIKPFSTRELLARVSTRLEIARTNREAIERERELRTSAEQAEGMTRLHELSTRLMVATELQPLLEEVLDATMTMLNADFGNVQLYDPETGALKIVAQRGFQQEFLDYFDRVEEGTASCGAALQRRREGVVVEDVETDPLFAPHRTIVAAAGYRAVQSTPLFSRGGEPLGMISTHFRRPHRPSERELRFVDLYARPAAEMIERNRAEEALHASEERFRRYFELGLIGMAMTSSTKGILEVNDELCRILGYERSELLQKTWAEMTHPDDLAADVAQFNRVMAGEIDGYALDKRWIRKDGQVIDTIVAVKCLRHADGSVDYFVGFVQDITERKRAEEELHRSEEKFRLAVESVRDYAIFALDRSGHIISWNAGAEHIKGYRSEEIIGRHFSCFYSPEELGVGKPEMGLRIAAAEGRFEDEGWRIRKDGSRFWANTVITALRGPQGELAGFSKMTRDLTEPKQAQEKLRESERRFRLLAETIPQHVWSCLPDGTVDYCNQRWVDYTGLTLQDIQNYGWTKCPHPADVEPVEKAWQEAKLHGKPYEVEQRIRGVDGRYRRFLSRAVPVYGERGQLMQWFGTDTDIEERKQAEEALGEAQAELAHITRVTMLGELVASIAHEVNQPLGAIVTNGQACLRLLARESPDLHKSREVVERMISDGMRASDVITRIRALLKRNDAEKALLHVNEIIQEVITFTGTELNKHEIHLRTVLAADLPLVLADRVQLQQVILNLILNAKEAMSGMEWQPRELCITSLSSESGEVVVAVRDSGTGFDPRDSDRIFDAFFTTKAEGLGLGLSISRTIIEAHGGRLWASSNEEHGATIQFALPASGRKG